MEDGRFRALLEKVINFNWEEPRPSALRAEYEEHRGQLHDLWRASTDEAEKARLWSELRAPAPAAVRAEIDEYKKRFREFRRELRRDFPEWHYLDGSRVRQFVGGEGGHTPYELREAYKRDDSTQSKLRKVWELASTGEADKAKRKLRMMSEDFTRNAERALATTASWASLEKHEKEMVPCVPRPKEAATLKQMVETLEWLQKRLRSLKVCGNPKCSTGKKYFFCIYPNDRYCSKKCEMIAKALRKAKRDAESQKPPKVYKLSEKTRAKMSISAILRHASDHAEKGKNKSKRP